MARLELQLPPYFGFATEVIVYTGHINQGAHLDNAQALSLVAEARTRWFTSLGMMEGQVLGLTMTVADVLWLYRAEAFYGDVLRIEVAARDFNRYGFDLVYRATRTADAREIGRGKQGLIFLDPATRRPSVLPQSFVDGIAAASAPA